MLKRISLALAGLVITLSGCASETTKDTEMIMYRDGSNFTIYENGRRRHIMRPHPLFSDTWTNNEQLPFELPFPVTQPSTQRDYSAQ